MRRNNKTEQKKFMRANFTAPYHIAIPTNRNGCFTKDIN